MLGQEIFSILRTFGRTKEVHCICVFREVSGKWNTAEVKLTRSLGYGTYRFQVRDVSHLRTFRSSNSNHLGPALVQRATGTSWTLSWSLGIPLIIPTLNYVVQPYYVPADSVAFRVPPGLYTHSFRVGTGESNVSTVAGSGNTTGGHVINQHVFTHRCAFTGGRIGAHRLVCILSRPYPAGKRK